MNLRRLIAFCLLVVGLASVPAVIANPAYSQAEDAFLASDHAAVVRFASQALASDPGLHDARFLRGMSRNELGDIRSALADLDAYLDTGAATYRGIAKKMADVLREKVEQTLPAGASLLGAPTPVERNQTVDSSGVLEASGPEGLAGGAAIPMRFTLSTGYHYDDRVVLRPVEGDAPQDPISDSAFHLRAHLDMSPPNEGYIARYDGDWLLYDKASRESRLSQTVELGWHSGLGTEHQDFELVGIGDLVLLDFEGYRRRFGAAATWTQMPGTRRDWASLRAGKDTYDDYGDYDGVFWGGDLGQDYILGDYILSWSAGYLDQAAELPEVEFTDTHVGVSALWNLSDSLAAGIGGAWIDNPYDRFDPVFDDTRDDTFTTGQAFLRYQVTDYLSLEPSITLIQRDSSVEDLDYDRIIAELNAVLTRW